MGSNINHIIFVNIFLLVFFGFMFYYTYKRNKNSSSSKPHDNKLEDKNSSSKPEDKNSSGEIDDLKAQFKNAWWIMTNQSQQNSRPIDLRLTKQQGECFIDSIISKYGLSHVIANLCFPSFVLTSVKPDKIPLQETMDYFKNYSFDNLGDGCEVGEKCNIPSKYFDKKSQKDGTTIKVCNY
jgi:hypothetical protein